MTYKLPPLPEPDHSHDRGDQLFYRPDQMQAYAIAAIEAQGVPDGLLNALDNFEKKERSPFQAYLAAGLVNELRTAMLASAPPAPQAELGDKPLSQDQFNLWFDALPWHVRGMWPTQTSVVQQEPLGFISPKQVERIVDPDGEFGAYIPMRKTPAGNFTLAVYTHPAQQAKPQPLLSSEIWNNDAIMEVNADARLPYELIERFVRAVEASHGITKE